MSNSHKVKEKHHEIQIELRNGAKWSFKARIHNITKMFLWGGEDLLLFNEQNTLDLNNFMDNS